MGSASTIPRVDLSSFSYTADLSIRKAKAVELAEALHAHGVVGITGHGFPLSRLRESFEMSKALFSLPLEDKLKAPHPKGLMPHRGYCQPGMEKAYTNSELKTDSTEIRDERAQIVDFKEHYEIGSEEDENQNNIWLPEQVLPGFKEHCIKLYKELHSVAVKHILEALLIGLETDPKAVKKFQNFHTGDNNHLRLLHYPPFDETKVDRKYLDRCGAHTDFTSFTILFQDSVGGLEFEDRSNKGTFMPAVPEEGTLYLNVGDLLEIFSNGYYPAASHRVQIPPSNPDSNFAPGRYSIAYFISMAEDDLIEPQSTGRPGQMPDGKFQATTNKEYVAFRTKWQFEEERKY